MFAQAVVSSLCSRDIHKELPDTFYLDADRLRVLRSELEDLVHFEICFSMFNQLLKELGHDAAISNATRNRLRSSLSAIMAESMGHGTQAWIYNSDSLSLEIYRQAQVLAGRTPVFDHHNLQATSECLHSLFYHTFTPHASTLEAVLLPQVLGFISKHVNSSPTELYNNLVTSPPPTSTPAFLPAPLTIDTFFFYHNTPFDRLSDLAKRISHIVLLHWRIWAPIAYVQDDASSSIMFLPPPPPPTATASTKPQPASPIPLAPICPAPGSEHDAQVVGVMMTGEAPDSGSGYEGNVSDQTRLP
jgi:hypothetical protein